LSLVLNKDIVNAFLLPFAKRGGFLSLKRESERDLMQGEGIKGVRLASNNAIISLE
jgi:hypothetical protein